MGNNTSSGKEIDSSGKKVIFYLYNIKPHPDKDAHHLLNTKTLLPGICRLGASKGQIKVKGFMRRYITQPGSSTATLSCMGNHPDTLRLEPNFLLTSTISNNNLYLLRELDLSLSLSPFLTHPNTHRVNGFGIWSRIWVWRWKTYKVRK